MTVHVSNQPFFWFRLISYSYGQLGVIEFFAGLFTFFVVLGHNGWLLKDLIGIQAQWDSNMVNDLKDSYGQEWVSFCFKSYFQSRYEFIFKSFVSTDTNLMTFLLILLTFVSPQTFYQRKQLEHTGWTGYFCTVVVCQWGNVLISKVRRAPLHVKLFE